MTSRPKCPKNVPAEVAATFKMFAAMMTAPTAPDGPALLMLAESWTTWRTARADVARLGSVVMSGGCAIANPSLAVAAQAHQQIVGLLKELGLTASSRKKLSTPEETPALSILRRTGG